MMKKKMARTTRKRTGPKNPNDRLLSPRPERKKKKKRTLMTMRDRQKKNPVAVAVRMMRSRRHEGSEIHAAG